jgi:hypothetical protein
VHVQTSDFFVINFNVATGRLRIIFLNHHCIETLELTYWMNNTLALTSLCGDVGGGTNAMNRASGVIIVTDLMVPSCFAASAR